ncbi:MAG TPA: amidohydrolase family protein [Candidatus Methylomirabilis sp.]|jgi:aminocarboxymuconate-semialdehyde decarboxylase
MTVRNQRTGTARRARPGAVDVHAHLAPQGFLAEARRGAAGGPRLERNAEGHEFIVFDEKAPAGYRRMRLMPQEYDHDARLAEMDAGGIDVQVLSLTPPFFHYWADPARGKDFCRMANEEIGGLVRRHPDRFLGMATVPLQNPAAAAEELAYARRTLGLVGVEIGSHINGRELDDPALHPFFARCAELRMPVFIHPIVVAGADRMTRYYLRNLIGNLVDTSIALAHLIYGGAFVRWPGLVVIAAHAGGIIPYTVGRLDHGYRVRPECRAALPRRPSAYLRHVYFDTIAHDREALAYLVRRFGADRVVLGSDFPFDMADPNPVGTLRGLRGLSARDRRRILSGNARALFGGPARAARAPAGGRARGR